MIFCDSLIGRWTPLCAHLPFVGHARTESGSDPISALFSWAYAPFEHAASLGAQGWLGALVKIVGWSADIICCTILDPETCASVSRTLTFLVAASILALICFGLDCTLKPVLFVAFRCWRAWKYVRNTTDEHLTHSVGDCEWGGPGTDAGVTNDFFSTRLRGRSPKNKKLNHLLILHEGQYARLSRANRAKPTNRNGLLWDVGDIVETSGNSIRQLIEEFDPQLICCCRELECKQTAAAMHVKVYAGVDANAIMDLRNESYSPTWLCCLKMYTLVSPWFAIPKRGCIGTLCRLFACKRGCCSTRRRIRPGGNCDKHPDSESEPETNPCKAECIA